jgi:hypothetical protein
MAFVMVGMMRIIVGIIARHRASAAATSGRTGRVVPA